MKFTANIKLHFNGALDVTAADNHTARPILASFFGSVLQEIQTWPTVDLNEVHVTSKLTEIGPSDAVGKIRAHYDFVFNGVLEIDNGELHDARHSLSELEASILDEVANWPTTELALIKLSANITAI